jgi:PKD repeat protein
VGQPVTLSAEGSTDAETPGNLTYSWDFGDGGTIKDATGKTVNHAYTKAGTYAAKVTVSDPEGLNDTATATVTVTQSGGPGGPTAGPVARIRVKPKHPGTDRKVRFVGKKSTGTGTLTYAWNFHNGGTKVDGTGKKVKTFVRRVGLHKITLTVTDSTGATAKSTVSYRVRHHYANRVTTTRQVSPHLFRGLIRLW